MGTFAIVAAMGVSESSPARLDLVVIGGGINGTGVLRDAALRGLRGLLVERHDFGFGASGNSSGMIHGGPRYLTHDPAVTESSCLDSGYIQKIAPHMLFRVPFLVPVLEEGARGALQLLTYDAFFSVYDRYQYLKRSKKHLRFSAQQVSELEPGLVPTRGAVCFDEWGLDGVRLSIANAVDAVERGARVLLGHSVVELLRHPSGKVVGVRVQPTNGGPTKEIFADVVVHATGAWSGKTMAALGLSVDEARVRPGKGTHVYLDRRLSNFAIVTNAIDGRQVFLLPWQNMSVLGTTDDDYYGDLDRVFATEDEVEYLFQAIERVFPSVRSARPIGTWAGLRPTLFSWGVTEDALSREHRIVDHASFGSSGLYSMIGGKLASYRLFAEEMTDRVALALGSKVRSRTFETVLPGGDAVPRAQELGAEFGFDGLVARRLVTRHGSRARRILELARDEGSGRVVCPCEPVTEAEVRYVVRHEWACSVDDVARRTRLGLGSCAGRLCATVAAEIVAQELGQGHVEALELEARFAANQAARLESLRLYRAPVVEPPSFEGAAFDPSRTTGLS